MPFKLRIFVILIINLGLIISSCAPLLTSTSQKDVSQNGKLQVKTTVTENFELSELGIGAEQRSQVVRAFDLMKLRHFREAEEIIDQVILYFKGQMKKPGVIYVSVASQSELDIFKKDVSMMVQVIWLDWSFQRALSHKAFILSDNRRYSEALEILDEQTKIAPFAASAYVEKGSILNQQKHPEEALVSYENALKLSRNFKSSKDQEAASLRGIGVTLIDLGNLDKAETVLKESLVIEPGNKISENELEYIKQMRKRSF
jgi:tetratricopeptide (TPR) repeat protein